MSNQYGPSDADPAGNQPTEPFWAGPVAPTATPGWGAPPGPGFPGHQTLRLAGQPKHRKPLHWMAGLLVAVLLVSGGTIAGMRLAGQSSPASGAAAPAQAGPPAIPQREGALLNDTLGDATVPGALTAAGATLTRGAGAAAVGAQARLATKGSGCARARQAARSAHRTGLRRLARQIGIGAAHCRLARRRIFAFFLLRGVDGQFTVQARNGTKTLAFERGVIVSVSAGKSITVKASDGTTWTWGLVSTTVVRDSQGKVSQSELTAGTQVWAGGPSVQGTKDARLIVVRPPQPAPVSPSSAPGN
jgi:hypothetical protein